MAAFYNQASLTYKGGTVLSNVASGEILEILSVTKTAVGGEYASGGELTYVINLVNSGASPLSDLTLTDDLGSYTFGTMTLVPLGYIDGTASYFVNGVPQAAPDVTEQNPLTITGISVPAGGNAAVVYSVNANEYAPPEQGGEIVNTVTVSGGGVTPVSASATVTASEGPVLEMLKSVSPEVVSDNGSLTYTFTIQNFGAAEAGTEAGIVLNDTFDPLLSNLAVTYNGAAWTADTDYSYDPATGVFTTTQGEITVPAATFTQNAETGVWTAVPGEATVTVSGSV